MMPPRPPEGTPALRLHILQRRADHLQQRITANPDKNLSHDVREVEALRWAIAELERKAV